MSYIKVENLFFRYGDTTVLKNIDFEVNKNTIHSIIGPSGCGKSTLLRCFNRLYDPGRTNISGKISLQNYSENILSKSIDEIDLRQKIGMVFQKANPFPKSIYENVVYGLKVRGIKDKRLLSEKCEEALKLAGLWDEVKDRLSAAAFSLSGGQQQRLCIARSLVVEPEILLLDEPTSALDPISLTLIEDLILNLKKRLTLILVTHNLNQAKRVSDHVTFLFSGELIESLSTEDFFKNSKKDKTKMYINGFMS
jgi:phosphate transport system ATP-binding protein